MTRVIQSVQNNQVKNWAKLLQKKYRDTMNQYLIEGEHSIEEALRYDVVDTLLVTSENHRWIKDERTILVSQEIINKLSTNLSKVNEIAVCNKVIQAIENYTRGVILDRIQDPGNMGTIIRSAVSFGYDYIFLSEDCVDIYNDKCLRSTQGAIFQIPILIGNMNEFIAQLKQKEVQLLVTSLHQATPLRELKKVNQFALVLGNEGQGVSSSIVDQADQTIYIEMEQFESLNVAVAAGICMYELRYR